MGDDDLTGQVCQPPVTTLIATVLPPRHAQLVVMEAPSTAAVWDPEQESRVRHLAITSTSGEKRMSVFPPAIGIMPSAVPWIASTETGAERLHGTSALPSAVAMLPETGAIAATRLDSSQPSR